MTRLHYIRRTDGSEELFELHPSGDTVDFSRDVRWESTLASMRYRLDALLDDLAARDSGS